MTPEERAGQIWEETHFHEGSGTIDATCKAIADAIREAVAAEREACAMLAEMHNGLYTEDCAGNTIATYIRARKDGA